MPSNGRRIAVMHHRGMLQVTYVRCEDNGVYVGWTYSNDVAALWLRGERVDLNPPRVWHADTSS